MNRFEKEEAFEQVRTDAWKVAEELIELAIRCEEADRRKAGEGLREIVNQIERWTRWAD